MVYFSPDHFFVSLVAFLSFMLILFPRWVFVMFFCEYLWSVPLFFLYTVFFLFFFNSFPLLFSLSNVFLLSTIFSFYATYLYASLPLLNMDIFLFFDFWFQFFLLWFTYHHSHTYFIRDITLPPCWLFSSFLLSSNYSSSSLIFLLFYYVLSFHLFLHISSCHHLLLNLYLQKILWLKLDILYYMQAEFTNGRFFSNYNDYTVENSPQIKGKTLETTHLRMDN